MSAASLNAADDDERLKSRYIGRVSRGLQEERLLLENANSVEGSISLSLKVCLHLSAQWFAINEC